MLVFCAILIFGITSLNAVVTKGITVADKPQYQISIMHGDSSIGKIKIQLFPEVAPQHCRNFDSLVSIGFYNRTAFHRVIPGFMIQGGDPNSRDKDKSTWGYGDPAQRKIPAEFSTLKHLRGTLSAARSNDPNSATSQFFICVVPCPWLDGQYSIYGEVLEGLDVVDYIVNAKRDQNDNPLVKIEMTIIKLDPNDVNETDTESKTANIYPNPAGTTLYVRGFADITSNYDIINIFGQTFQSGLLNSGSADISGLTSGTFFIRINSKNNGVISIPFIKEPSAISSSTNIFWIRVPKEVLMEVPKTLG